MNLCLPHQRWFIWSHRLRAVAIIAAFAVPATTNAQDRPQFGILGRDQLGAIRLIEALSKS
jgi:heme A synthase